ncbi:MAG: hypothetical protein Fur0022_12470 [Anaerolineales bacterium]
MLHKRSLTFVIVAILLATLGVGLASAGAYDTSFTTSITYQNVGDGTATINLLFYDSPTSTSPITVPLSNLAAGAGSSVFVGSLGDVDPGFEGTAIMQSDQPLLATLVQVPQGSTTVKVRPLSNGFSSGGPTALIATVLKNTFDENVIISVQNIDTEQNDVTVTFYDTAANDVHTITQANLEPGAGFYVDAGQISELGTSFNGSAVVTAVRNDSTDGNIIASALDLKINGVGGLAFESVPSGGLTFYMPTALCNVFGGQNTSYAIQNTSLDTATNVTVEYSSGDTETKTIGPGAKASFVACDVNDGGFTGSAVVTSDTTAIIAVGKAYGAGLSTGFMGAASGYESLALPYVRYTSDANYLAGTRQRVFIAIQNVGASDVSNVTVEYVDKNGAVVGTHTIASIAAGAKANSNASNAGLTEFGYYNDNTFGGSVIITGPAGSQLVAIARVNTCTANNGTTCTLLAGEDYNAMPVP